MAADQKIRAARHAQALGQRACDQLRLIVATLSQAAGVLRYRYQNVEGTQFLMLACDLAQARREPTAERNYLLVLEKNNGANSRRRVSRIAPRKIKIVKAAATHVTERLGHTLHRDRRNQRAPTPRTERVPKSFEGGEARSE